MTKGESSFPGQAEPSSEASGFTLSVTVLETDESTPRTGVTVKITNETTDDTATATTNGSGIATFTLNTDLTSGYEIGDLIKAEQVIDEDEVEIYATANGDETNPTLVQCANDTRTQIQLNTARILLNTSRNPATFDLKITLND